MAQIFISHSSADNDQAAHMKAWLASVGFEATFLDKDRATGIPPGADWERTLYREVELSHAVIIIQTPNWLASKWCFAEFTQARALGKSIFPAIVAPTGDTLISPDIQTLNLLSDRDGGLDRLKRELVRIALDAQGGFGWDARRAPFPGMLALDEEDAAVYFGRDDDIRRFIERLEARRAQGGPKLIALLGSSGSGKSSLLRAGIIPRLKRAARNWIVVPPMRPRLHPIDELATALAIARNPPADWAKVRGDLMGADPGRALEGFSRSLLGEARANEARILIPIDQAEELFGVADRDEASRFMAVLSQALSEGLPFIAVMTIRSDFLEQIQSAASLTARFEEFSLGPMPLARIPQVIEGPARRTGLRVEDELVQQAAHDAETEDALPLLAFTLRQLFDLSKDGSLTLQAYLALGDEAAGLTPLENAVRKAADTVLAEANATSEEMAALREAFVPAMVRVNEQGEYVRRPARMDALPPMSHSLLERLATARLLVIRQQGDARLVEVAHEALLRKWPWLKEKLDAERVFLIGKQQLEQDSRDWQAAADKDKTDALLTGLKLTRARAWLLEHPARLTPEERAFVQASIGREEAQKRNRERTRRTVIGVLGLMVIGLAIVAGWAYRAQDVATENAVRAQKALSDATLANSRAAQIQQIARQTGDPSLGPQRSLLLAVHAATLQPNDGVGLLGAIDGLRQQLRSASGLPLYADSENVVAAAYSPDRRWLAAGGADGLVRLHDLTAIDPRSAVHDLAGHHGPVAGLVFAADSHRLLSAGSDRTLRLWQVDTASPVAGRVISVKGKGPIRALAASPDGKWLAFGTESGELCLWRWQPNGPEEAPCDPAWRDVAPVTTVMFSPKGRWLATTCTGACKGFDAPVRLWDLSLKGSERGPKSLVHKSPLTEPSLLAIAFSADETRLAAAYGYVAELWDLTQPDPSATPLGTYPGGGGWITALDISADGRWLALGSTGSNDVLLWRLSGDRGDVRGPAILPGHGGSVTVVRFGGNGRWLASAAADGSLYLWDLAQPVLRGRTLRGHDLPIRALRFSPEDEPGYLLSWGQGEPARLWHLPDPGVDPLVLRGPVGPLLMGMALSADGRWIASSSQDDNQLALWSIQDPRAPTHLLAMPGFARSIAFSRDGRWLAAKSQDRGRISLWSLRNLAEPPRVMVQDGWSDDRTLRFSPDSRWLASGSYGGQDQPSSLDFWDVSTDTPALQPRYHCRPTSPVREFVFSDDAKLLATAAQDRAAYLWKLGSENPCSSPTTLPHGNVVYQISLSRDGRWAATASMDQKGRLWDLEPGTPPKLVREIEFEDRVTRAVFSPDNQWVAFASWDHSAALLDLRAPATSAAVRLRGHVGLIQAAVFSPDSQWLATAGEDRTIRLWRPDTAGAAPIVLRGHNGSVHHLGFSPDGVWLVSGAYDGTVRLWRLRLKDLMQTACAVAGRALTPAEINQYLGGAYDRSCTPQSK